MVKLTCYSGGKKIRSIKIAKPLTYEAEQGAVMIYAKGKVPIFHWSGDYTIESDKAEEVLND